MAQIILALLADRFISKIIKTFRFPYEFTLE